LNHKRGFWISVVDNYISKLPGRHRPLIEFVRGYSERAIALDNNLARSNPGAIALGGAGEHGLLVDVEPDAVVPILP
jgi:hypothetical protein